MSEKYKFSDPKGVYLVNFTIIHWIDLFTRCDYVHEVIKSLQHCQKEKGLVIYAWLVMPSHMHMIISSDREDLPAIIRDFKKFTAKRIIKLLSEINESRREWLLNAFSKAGSELKRIKSYKVWKDGSHPILLDNNKMIDQWLNNIHANPVAAGIVSEGFHYKFSSASNYAGQGGLMEVKFIA